MNLYSFVMKKLTRSQKLYINFKSTVKMGSRSSVNTNVLPSASQMRFLKKKISLVDLINHKKKQLMLWFYKFFHWMTIVTLYHSYTLSIWISVIEVTAFVVVGQVGKYPHPPIFFKATEGLSNSTRQTYCDVPLPSSNKLIPFKKVYSKDCKISLHLKYMWL